jgi:hypothetical protein
VEGPTPSGWSLYRTEVDWDEGGRSIYFRDPAGNVVELASPDPLERRLGVLTECHRLTNRWSQPLAIVKSTFNFMKQFPMLLKFAAASGGSAWSR